MQRGATVRETGDARASFSAGALGTLGMWLFLATEVLFFGGLFMVFATYRTEYGLAFAAASRHLDVVLGTVNTAVLITSSLTMALAVAAAEERRRGLAVAMSLSTAALGAAFLGVKALEYRHEIEAGRVPGGAALSETPQQELFFGLYFAMTGLHALHLAIGIGLVLTLAARLARGLDRVAPYVRPTGLYWHFVDVVWVFLFPLLYLIDR